MIYDIWSLHFYKFNIKIKRFESANLWVPLEGEAMVNYFCTFVNVINPKLKDTLMNVFNESSDYSTHTEFTKKNSKCPGPTL